MPVQKPTFKCISKKVFAALPRAAKEGVIYFAAVVFIMAIGAGMGCSRDTFNAAKPDSNTEQKDEKTAFEQTLPGKAVNAALDSYPITGLPDLTSKKKKQLYYFPVQPPTEANYGKYHHDYPATDIFAPEGTPFVAVTNGTITFTRHTDTWKPGNDDPAARGGISVSLNGNDGVRYYASHLQKLFSWVQVGEKVHAGQILGYVGKTGNARYTPSHIHFGISPPGPETDWKTRRGIISPYPYLKAWEQGDMIRPQFENKTDGDK